MRGPPFPSARAELINFPLGVNFVKGVVAICRHSWDNLFGANLPPEEAQLRLPRQQDVPSSSPSSQEHREVADRCYAELQQQQQQQLYPSFIRQLARGDWRVG